MAIAGRHTARCATSFVWSKESSEACGRSIGDPLPSQRKTCGSAGPPRLDDAAGLYSLTGSDRLKRRLRRRGMRRLHGSRCQSPADRGARYVPVNSCLLLLPMAAGLEIYTVEALAQNGTLAEVQQAMVDFGGSQCGYCTPGFVMSMFCEQYRPGRTTPCDVHALGGNLCRCTGYRPIRDAALSLGPAPDGALRDRLTKPPLPRLRRARMRTMMRYSSGLARCRNASI